MLHYSFSFQKRNFFTQKCLSVCQQVNFVIFVFKQIPVTIAEKLVKTQKLRVCHFFIVIPEMILHNVISLALLKCIFSLTFMKGIILVYWGLNKKMEFHIFVHIFDLLIILEVNYYLSFSSFPFELFNFFLPQSFVNFQLYFLQHKAIGLSKIFTEAF